MPGGSALVGLQIRHLNNTEDPVQFARRISVRDPLAIATDDPQKSLELSAGAILPKRPTLCHPLPGAMRTRCRQER